MKRLLLVAIVVGGFALGSASGSAIAQTPPQAAQREDCWQLLTAGAPPTFAPTMPKALWDPSTGHVDRHHTDGPVVHDDETGKDYSIDENGTWHDNTTGQPVDSAPEDVRPGDSWDEVTRADGKGTRAVISGKRGGKTVRYVRVPCPPPPTPTPTPTATPLNMPLGEDSPAASPSPAPKSAVRMQLPVVYFGADETSISSHNGNLYGGGWGTTLYGGVKWNHFNDTFSYNRISVPFDQGYWDDDYWGDDFDYDWDLDWPDGQYADVYAGPSYQHLGFNDMGFGYSGNGIGFNAGFDWQTQPRIGVYGRITYIPTVTTTLTQSNGANYQLSKQQYDFGVRYKLDLSTDLYLKGGFKSEIFQSKNSQNAAGGIYNFGPYLGLQYTIK